MKSNKSAKRKAGGHNGKAGSTKTRVLIDVKQAAKSAAQYFAQLYSDKQYSDLLLEEVELSEDEKHWMITLSYYPEPPLKVSDEPSFTDALFGNRPKRRYKLFKIDATTGKVEAMKIRSI